MAGGVQELMNTIAVFGATGHTGRLITGMLLEEEAVEVIASSRTPEKLARLKGSLSDAGARLRVHAADIRQGGEVDALIAEADLIVGATSRWQDGPLLAAKAVEQSTDYCGITLSNPEKWRQLRALHAASLDAGVMIVDDCGTHPGLPAVMIRWMQSRAPLRSALVGAHFDLQWDELESAAETVGDFLHEIESVDPSILVDGAWKKGFSNTERFDFGDGEGPRACTPMLMEEIRELAEGGDLESTGFFMAGFGPAVDYGVMPLSMVLARINRGAAERLFLWGIQRFASRSETAVLQLDGERAPDGGKVSTRVSQPSPYFLTAAPVIATIRQMLETPRPGVWTQGAFVDPDALFSDLEGFGVQLETRL